MMPRELIEAFKVLAQSTDDLSLYFPRGEENLLYRRVDENGFYDDVWLPSKVAALTCASIIHDLFHTIVDDSVKQVASEIQSLILIMIDISSEYHWMIDKNAYMIQGPYDTSWAILRRLASVGLTAISSEIQPPQSTFGEFVKLGKFSEWKIVPASGQDGEKGT